MANLKTKLPLDPRPEEFCYPLVISIGVRMWLNHD